MQRNINRFDEPRAGAGIEGLRAGRSARLRAGRSEGLRAGGRSARLRAGRFAPAGRALCALAALGLCLLLAPAAFGSTPTAEFTWAGGGATTELGWSLAGNWAGGKAPEEEEAVKSLTFPKLSGSACEAKPETKACYHSEDNEVELSTEALKLDDGDDYALSGSEELALGAGGLTASPEGSVSGARDELGLGIELTKPQTWSIAGRGGAGGAKDNGLLLEATAEGETHELKVRQSEASAFVVGPNGAVEVSDAEIEGANTARSDAENGSTELLGGEINSFDEKSVKLSHISFAGYGELGKLTTEDVDLTVGGSGEQPGALEAISAKLDAASTTVFQIDGAKPTAGVEYSQLVSDGAAELAGTLAVEVRPPSEGRPCPTLVDGEEYTLVEATTKLSGTFSNASAGASLPLHFVAGCAEAAQVLQIAYDMTTHEVVGTVKPKVKTKKEEEEEAAAKKKQEEEEATAKKHEEEEAAAKKHQEEEEAAATKRHEEEAAATKKHEEEAAATKKHEEEAAAAKKHEEEAAATKKHEEEEAAKKAGTGGTTQTGGGTTTTTTQGGGGGGGSSVEPAPDVTVVGTSVTVSSSGAFAVTVACPAADASCTGTITLRTLKAVVARVAKARAKQKAAILTLATGSFTVAGGQTKVVSLHLTAAGNTLLAHSHTLSARATIVARDKAGASATAQAALTLKAQRPRGKGKR